jgi:hypothetical protein
VHQNWAGVIGPAASSVRVAGAAAAGADCGWRIERCRRGGGLALALVALPDWVLQKSKCMFIKSALQ